MSLKIDQFFFLFSFIHMKLRLNNQYLHRRHRQLWMQIKKKFHSRNQQKIYPKVIIVIILSEYLSTIYEESNILKVTFHTTRAHFLHTSAALSHSLSHENWKFDKQRGDDDKQTEKKYVYSVCLSFSFLFSFNMILFFDNNLISSLCKKMFLPIFEIIISGKRRTCETFFSSAVHFGDFTLLLCVENMFC